MKGSPVIPHPRKMRGNGEEMVGKRRQLGQRCVNCVNTIAHGNGRRIGCFAPLQGWVWRLLLPVSDHLRLFQSPVVHHQTRNQQRRSKWGLPCPDSIFGSKENLAAQSKVQASPQTLWPQPDGRVGLGVFLSLFERTAF